MNEPLWSVRGFLGFLSILISSVPNVGPRYKRLEVAFCGHFTLLLKAVIFSLLCKEKMNALGVSPCCSGSLLLPETTNMGPIESIRSLFNKSCRVVHGKREKQTKEMKKEKGN